MMMLIRFLSLLLLFGAVAGCQSRLGIEKSAELNPDGIVAIDVDSPRYDQPVHVEYSSTGCEIAVYVCLEKDKSAAEAALTAKKVPSSILGSSVGRNGQFDFSVPAGNKFSVFLANASAVTNVTVNIAGR
jgi:hypothetical protein